MPRRTDRDKDKIAALGVAVALLTDGFRQAEDGAAAVNAGLQSTLVGTIVGVTGGGPLTPAGLSWGQRAAGDAGRRMGAALERRFRGHEFERARREGAGAMEDVARRAAGDELPARRLQKTRRPSARRSSSCCSAAPGLRGIAQTSTTSRTSRTDPSGSRPFTSSS